MRRRVVCLLAMTIAFGFCFLKAYETVPTRASWTGSVNGYVGQTVTACWDSITEVHVFIGDVGALALSYNVGGISGTQSLSRNPCRLPFSTA
jgi:hypothetical protein